jgi:hypothetical protein
VSCWRRLRGWTEAGVWPTRHELLLAELDLICDAGGIPLAVTFTGGSRNDVTQLIPLVDAVPPIRRRRGRPCGRSHR